MIANLILIGTYVGSIGLLIAALVALRLWRRRNRLRSPLKGRKLAHLPGHQLVARISEHGDEMLIASMLMCLSFPVMLTAWALRQVDWSSIRFGSFEALTILAALGLFGFGLRSFQRHSTAYWRCRDGMIAEQLTGQLLNRLVPRVTVAHDLPCEGFNIDHVVIAPHAVFAVETKSFRKPKGSDDGSHFKVRFDGTNLRFPSWTESGAIDQARRQARWLAQFLRDALDREIPVVPALALPGWWIDQTEGAAGSDVRVFTPMGRGAECMLRGAERLDESTRKLVALAIAQRYPHIED